MELQKLHWDQWQTAFLTIVFRVMLISMLLTAKPAIFDAESIQHCLTITNWPAPIFQLFLTKPLILDCPSDLHEKHELSKHFQDLCCRVISIYAQQKSLENAINSSLTHIRPAVQICFLRFIMLLCLNKLLYCTPYC